MSDIHILSEEGQEPTQLSEEHLLSLLSKPSVNYSPDEQRESVEGGPTLRRVTFQFNTTGDNLNPDTPLDLMLYLPPGGVDNTFAYLLGRTGGDGAETGGPRIDIPVAKTMTREGMRGCFAKIEMGHVHDQWNYILAIEIEFTDGTKNVWGPKPDRLGTHGGWPSYNIYSNLF